MTRHKSRIRLSESRIKRITRISRIVCVAIVLYTFRPSGALGYVGFDCSIHLSPLWGFGVAFCVILRSAFALFCVPLRVEPRGRNAFCVCVLRFICVPAQSVRRSLFRRCAGWRGYPSLRFALFCVLLRVEPRGRDAFCVCVLRFICVPAQSVRRSLFRRCAGWRGYPSLRFALFCVLLRVEPRGRDAFCVCVLRFICVPAQSVRRSLFRRCAG